MLFAATKGAVDEMAHAIAKELGPKGITVNAITPSPIATDVFLRDNLEGFVAGLKATSPFYRFGGPDDVANVFRFMCSKESSGLKGRV